MPKPLQAGTVLKERYRINRIIGQGGMGNVYLADDLRLEGRKCALKEVDHDLTMEENIVQQAREQFQREATVLARLDHPNLPKVSDFFLDNGRDYLVMDYIPGKDLRTVLIEYRRRGEFIPERQILAWASQLCDALIYLHSQATPILHRDIKPSNMKVTPNGLLKLVDFGLVKFMAPDEMTITVLQGRGTALYTPLEQYGGDTGHTDGRSDVYAFGATLYHLLTGTAPVEARERFLKPGVLPSIQELNPEVSPRTQRVVLWAMGLHPSERPSDVETFKKALLGDWNPGMLSKAKLPSMTMTDLLYSPLERGLFLIIIGLFFFNLIVTLLQ